MTSRDIALEAALEAARRACPLQDVLSRRLSESGLAFRDRALAEEVAFGALEDCIETAVRGEVTRRDSVWSEAAWGL